MTFSINIYLRIYVLFVHDRQNFWKVLCAARLNLLKVFCAAVAEGAVGHLHDQAPKSKTKFQTG
jgi:hypothetical protein